MSDHRLSHKSLPEYVTEYLKKQLSAKELVPGDEINLTTMRTVLGISRTPIREALIHLVKEGLVVVSRRKFIIKKLTVDDIRNLYDAIGLLEADAAQAACEGMKEADIVLLDDYHLKMLNALDQVDTLTYLELNSALHDLIISYCRNRVILELLQNLKERLNVIIVDFRKAIESLPEWKEILITDHARMIEAIKARDQEALGRIIKEAHWDFSRNYPYLQKYYENFIQESENRLR